MSFQCLRVTLCGSVICPFYSPRPWATLYGLCPFNSVLRFTLPFLLPLSVLSAQAVSVSEVKRKRKTTTTTKNPKHLVFISFKGIYTIRHEDFPLVLLHNPTSLPCCYWDDWLDSSVTQPMSLPKGFPAIPLALTPQNIIWLSWGFSKLSCSDLYLLGSSFPNLPTFSHIFP